VRRIRDQFYPKTALNPDRVIGLDVIVRDAVDLECTAAQLRENQLKELIHILAHSV
jgi:NitT/TauT family transport system substrate-binding protein